ncbi:MAG: FHA domain-containing protein, partial [Gemmatimonadales bacterium]
MKAQFGFLSGARAGQIDVLGQPSFTVGRHPDCDLRFDADQDLQVSSRHATLGLEKGAYVLRDLDSTNGTFVNGTRVKGTRVLSDRDRIQFGANGPTVEFTALREEAPPPPAAGPSGTSVYPSRTPPERPAPQSASSPAPAPKPATKSETPSRPAGPGRTTMIRVEVTRQTARLRRTTVGLFGLLMLVTGAYFWQRTASARQLEAQRRILLAQVDSLIRQNGTISASVQSMQDALDSARAATNRLRQQLDRGTHDPADLEELQRRLAAAMKQQQNLSSAAQLDAPAITAANRDAIALVFVQYADGRTFTGTAFAVRSDQNGGFLLTNRHVVTDSAGARPLKIGVVFNGSNQNFRAELVTVHPEQDVALLHVTVTKGVPTVKGLVTGDPPVVVGQPVAVLGFPLGLDIPMGGDWTRVGVSATLTLGTASKALPTLL